MYDKSNDPRYPRNHYQQDANDLAHRARTGYEAFDRHQPRGSRAWSAFVSIIIVAALVALIGLLLLAPEARAQDVQSWEKLNEACQSEPILRKTGKDNPACQQRNRMSSQLVRQGWQQASHGIWLSPEQLRFAGTTISKYDRQLAANMGEFDSLMPAQLTELRLKLTDAQIFAIWNLRQDDIRANAPYAGAMLEETMARLAVHYSRSGDPRLTLGY